jgi:hypothetical protein
MNKYHYVEDVRFEGKVLHLVVDGDPYSIDVTRQSARLRDASLKAIQAQHGREIDIDNWWLRCIEYGQILGETK